MADSEFKIALALFTLPLFASSLCEGHHLLIVSLPNDALAWLSACCCACVEREGLAGYLFRLKSSDFCPWSLDLVNI